MERSNILNQTNSFNTSNKYKTITTNSLIDSLVLKGWTVRQVQKSRVLKSREGYQKHLARLQHPEFQVDSKGILPEIVIVNSHDGESSLKVMLGLYRLVCSNGLIAGFTAASRSIRHLGDASSKALIAVNYVQSQASNMFDEVQRMSSTTVNSKASHAFRLRVGEILNRDVSEDILRPRRIADSEPNMFNLFNTVQENIMHGLYTYRLEDLNVQRARVIKSIDRNVELNMSLWSAAVSMSN